MSFWDEINEWKKKLEEDNYSVIKYPEQFTSEFLPNYKIDGYIGASVFAEIAFTIGLNRANGKKIKVYCLNPFPDSLPYSEELKYWKNLGWIQFWK